VTVVELVGGIEVVMAVELVGAAGVASLDVVSLPPQATNATVQSAPRVHDTR
jgi:hypothetical protein